MNITEPIRRIARIRPDDRAIVRADDSTVSYAVLEHAIDRMAEQARRLRLRPGDIVALDLAGPDETLCLALALGLARIGVTTAASTVPARHLHMRFQSGAKTIPGAVTLDPSWLTLEPAAPDHEPVPVHRTSATPFRVFASSGTTGTPKHIVVSHDTMAHRVYGRWIAEGAGRANRMIGIGMGSNWGMESVLRTLWAGGTIVLANPAGLAATIARHAVNSIVMAPTSLSGILDRLPADHKPFPSLIKIEIGGSRLPEPIWRAALDRICPHIVTTLGSGECGGIASAPVDALTERPGAAGYIWPGVEIVAFDPDGNALPPGREGVLGLRGERLASRYLDGTESEEGFRDGWFHSADIGIVGEDGLLTLTGRANEVINAGGVKIIPDAIEAAMLTLPAIKEAAVFPVTDETGMTRVWAAIVASDDLTEDELAAFCDRIVPEIQPETILQVQALPRNANGKVVRRELAAAAIQFMRDRPEL